MNLPAELPAYDDLPAGLAGGRLVCGLFGDDDQLG